jgi:hypothetical protein
MKKKTVILKASALLLALTLSLSACIGSFHLTRTLHAWNQTIDDNKWVNELVFVALCSIQIYSVSLIIDGLILNSIEFWTGENPAATVRTEQIETENGRFTITTDARGHTIRKAGTDEAIAFQFDAQAKRWSLETENRSVPLVQFMADNQVKVFLAEDAIFAPASPAAGTLASIRAMTHPMRFGK